MKHKVKEAIHIKQKAPSMNRDQGYQLPPIYGQIIPRPEPTLIIAWWRSAEGRSKRRNRFTLISKVSKI